MKRINNKNAKQILERQRIIVMTAYDAEFLGYYHSRFGFLHIFHAIPRAELFAYSIFILGLFVFASVNFRENPLVEQVDASTFVKDTAYSINQNINSKSQNEIEEILSQIEDSLMKTDYAISYAKKNIANSVDREIYLQDLERVKIILHEYKLEQLKVLSENTNINSSNTSVSQRKSEVNNVLSGIMNR